MNFSYIPTINELLEIPIEESGEAMVRIPEREEFRLSFHNSQETVDLTGPVMWVREGVLQRLQKAAELLSEKKPNLRLWIFYAYRALSVQEKYYDGALETVRRNYPNDSPEEQLEAAHILSARPDLAGHPAGAAVDLGFFDLDQGEPLGFGLPLTREAIRSADKDLLRPDSRQIPDAIRERRLLLRKLMCSVGFAPFNGEFWHFSYGDRDWAAFTKAPKAIYGPVAVKDLR